VKKGQHISEIREKKKKHEKIKTFGTGEERMTVANKKFSLTMKLFHLPSNSSFATPE
jgi:hypothetical protein